MPLRVRRGTLAAQKARLSTHPPDPHPPLPLRRVVLLGAVVDGLLAALDDGHNQVVWPVTDKALVNLQRPSYCVEEARRLPGEGF